MYHSTSLSNSVPDPSLDVDAMLFDVSNRMAKAQLQRQMSNSSSSLHRRRPSKVTKPTSAGNSPQHVQRRRTMTSQRTARAWSELYQQGFKMSQQNMEAFRNEHPNAPVTVRPVSWHPSSMGFVYPRPVSTYEPSNRRSIAAYQTVDVHGMPTPMTQPDSNSDSMVDNWFSLEGNSGVYPQQMNYGFGPAGLRLDTGFPTNVHVDSNSATNNVSTAQSYPSGSSATYSTQTWTESLSTFPSYTAPPTPDILPIQNPTEEACEEEVGEREPSLPPLPRKDSKELVGMGLYDVPDRSSYSFESIGGDGTSYFSERHESMGKGLKLEDAWEPPEESDDDDDGEDEPEDGYAEDDPAVEKESEKAKAKATEVVVVSSEPATETMRQLYGDMSNQSFFFDGDDNYGDGMSMHATHQMMGVAPSVQSVPLNNFMWR